ncbi:glutaredoxin family protein [Vibrio neonatus]|uniref:glutaredoxin family protein n=1 Tax=Vibrio neonatus TaxID=278860 RepID=UPI0021C2BD93|nr:glutaredoxin domain-containing protein [Vibrio neonatus]
MKVIRILLGKIILLLNFLFPPKGIKRTSEAQQHADTKAKNLALYQFEACPFCVKVRREMKRQSIAIELKDAKNNHQAREELQNGGGNIKVPCLKITSQGKEVWMYESSDIIAYLQKEFA